MSISSFQGLLSSCVILLRRMNKSHVFLSHTEGDGQAFSKTPCAEWKMSVSLELFLLRVGGWPGGEEPQRLKARWASGASRAPQGAQTCSPV